MGGGAKKQKRDENISTTGSLRHRQVAVSGSPTPETPECSWGPDPSRAAWKRAGLSSSQGPSSAGAQVIH